jgi:hypothetical protein
MLEEYLRIVCAQIDRDSNFFWQKIFQSTVKNFSPRTFSPKKDSPVACEQEIVDKNPTEHRWVS